MFHSYYTHILIFLTSIVLLSTISSQSLAETFSGRVVDEEGNPVANVSVALHDNNLNATALSDTDESGAFSISATSSPVALMLHPEKKVEYFIRKVNISGLILYPDQHANSDGDIIFTMAEDAEIKDVEITVRKRISIRGRVLDTDGTPLKNVEIVLRFSGENINEKRIIEWSTKTNLDAKGYFDVYINHTGLYTVYVEYQAQLATADNVQIMEENKNLNLVLMLGGTTNIKNNNISVHPVPIVVTQPELPEQPPVIPPDTATESKEKSIFSGQVMDSEGKVISGFQLGMVPVRYIHGRAIPETESFNAGNVSETQIPRSTLLSQINSSGKFSLNNIDSGLLQLFIAPENTSIDADNITSRIQYLSHLDSEYELQLIKIGQMIFTNQAVLPRFSLKQFVFAITPGASVENVEITVKKKSQIRGRIIYADGSPVKNKSVKLRVKEPQNRELGPIRLGDADGYTLRRDIRTDNYGDFSIFVDKPGEYFFHVKLIVLSAEAGPITMKDKAQQNELLLKLNGTMIFPNTSTDEIQPNQQGFSADEQLPDVWIVNPTNGHSYKLVACEDWFDAHRQATQNGAHLLSINDEAEHKWIMELYGSGFFWIGLNDINEEGEWQWDGGEPVTYEHWESNELFPDDSLTDEEKDYGVMNLNGAWQKTAQQATIWIMTRQAIIENDGRLSNIQINTLPE